MINTSFGVRIGSPFPIYKKNIFWEGKKKRNENYGKMGIVVKRKL